MTYGRTVKANAAIFAYAYDLCMSQNGVACDPRLLRHVAARDGWAYAAKKLARTHRHAAKHKNDTTRKEAP